MSSQLFDERGRPRRPGHGLRNVLTLATLAAIAWATFGVGIDPQRLIDLPGQMANIVVLMFRQPNIDYFPRAFGAMLESVQMAWIGTIIGAIISLPMGFLAATNTSPRWVTIVVRQILNGIRAVPELIWAVVIMLPIFGLGPLSGALALGINSVGTLGKLTAEAIESIDPGPVEAARATGANQVQLLRWGVLPQIMPEVVAFWLYRFEINIRASAILGVIGAGGVGVLLSQLFSFRRWESIGVTILVIIGVTMAIDFVSSRLRMRIIMGPQAKAADSVALSEAIAKR